MGRAISVPQRQVIFQRAGLGHEARAIAADLGLNPETVRKLIARFRKAGAAAIAPDYSRCGANQTRRADADLIGAAMTMRREHPTWGAGIIRVILAERHPGRALPSERTIPRAFVRAGLNPAPAGRRRGGPGARAERPHETWQVDAADPMKLAGTGQASWLRIVDECSGAVLATAVFPPRALEHRGRRRDPGDAPRLLRAPGPARTDPGG
jgi:transposase